MNPLHVVIIGGGLAGLASAIKLVMLGARVSIVSITACKRSHSVCAQGGMQADQDIENGDSPERHFYDTVKGGDFLGDQRPIWEFALSCAPIFKYLLSIGIPFNRVASGDVDRRRFGGTKFNRTVFCGSSTGQQLLYGLDEQVRRFESEGKISLFEYYDFLKIVKDDQGACRGAIIMDTRTLEIISIKADAVVMATGGFGHLFRQSTNSTICTGGAMGRVYMQGCYYANPEMIQIHPTAMRGEDKCRLMTETLRNKARIWTFGNSDIEIVFPDGIKRPCGKTGEPWYFLEEMYPTFGNLVPRDIASRAIFHVCKHGLGIEGKKEVFLDCTSFGAEELQKYGSVLDIYQKFTGEDPLKVPMRIFPAFHYTMGGLYFDYYARDETQTDDRYRFMTNIKGLFAIGECSVSIHGANRLGGNSLISCIFEGLTSGPDIIRYLHSLKADALPSSRFEKEVEEEKIKQRKLLEKNGPENVFALHRALGEILVEHCTVERTNAGLATAIEQIKRIRELYKRIGLSDKDHNLNQTYLFAAHFEAMIEIALCIAKGALLRNESRGGHYKPEFPNRNDKDWLKTTIAVYDKESDEPKIIYRPVDTRYCTPKPRQYHTAEEKIDLHHLPEDRTVIL